MDDETYYGFTKWKSLFNAVNTIVYFIGSAVCRTSLGGRISQFGRSKTICCYAQQYTSSQIHYCPHESLLVKICIFCYRFSTITPWLPTRSSSLTTTTSTIWTTSNGVSTDAFLLLSADLHLCNHVLTVPSHCYTKQPICLDNHLLR